MMYHHHHHHHSRMERENPDIKYIDREPGEEDSIKRLPVFVRGVFINKSI